MPSRVRLTRQSTPTKSHVFMGSFFMVGFAIALPTLQMSTNVAWKLVS